MRTFNEFSSAVLSFKMWWRSASGWAKNSPDAGRVRLSFTPDVTTQMSQFSSSWPRRARSCARANWGSQIHFHSGTHASVCLSKHLSWASKINFIREDFSTLSFLFSLTPLLFLCTHLPLPPSLLSLPVCYLPAGSAPQACWGSVLDESHTLTICCPQTPHCWPRARRHARTCTCGTHAGPLSDEV